FAADTDVHPGRIVPAELHGIADQVEKDLGEQGLIALHFRERIPGDHGLGFLERRFEAGERVVERAVRSTVVKFLVRPTRENASRSLMRTCMRLAPSTAKSM